MFGELGFCCQCIIPEGLNQHRGQVQCLSGESGETQKQFIIATSQPLKDNVGETVPSASTSECFVPARCECSDAGLIPG